MGSFFLPKVDLPPNTSSEYLSIRDGKGLFGPQARETLEGLWAEFQDICADANFRSQAAVAPIAHVWTMWLARRLREGGIPLERAAPHGPDLCFRLGGRRYWIECVAAHPATAEMEAELRGIFGDLSSGVGRTIAGDPTLEIRTLQLTGALFTKKQAFGRYASSGIVSTDDVCIVAVSGGALPYADLVRHEAQWPDLVHGVFGVSGSVFMLPVRLSDDAPEPPEDIRLGYSPREKLEKSAGTPIDCKPFENDPTYVGISAVYYCKTDLWNLLISGGPLDLIHNPRARVPVALGSLPCTFEYTKDPDSPERFIQPFDRRGLR